MPDNIKKIPIMEYLHRLNDVYFGKVLELREQISKWLSYIPQAFPQYTSHTVDHSEEIIRQISKVLFKDDDQLVPTVKLSAIETYILITTAYLHDAGMVISDSEKSEILASDEWKQWISEEKTIARRWQEIEAIRTAGHPDGTISNFIADRQVRFLIAEFVRRTHHVRSARIINQHEASFGRFALNDPILKKAIVDVCIAHGLDSNELEDRERYPDRRDILGETANLRFIALLLRIGDLLDTSNDRACPLLMNAASPLPSESLAHWTKYQKITHRMTAPDKIEIWAKCDSQEEHRFLKDWCEWLVKEIKNAATLMSSCSRHNSWRPPVVSMGTKETPGTIDIVPSKEAKYLPLEWKFELDSDAVFQRLVNDLYSNPDSYIRELIQNGLDANRCQMYWDISAKGIIPPTYPTKVSSEIRALYPLTITLLEEEIFNEYTGANETRHVLCIEDCGVGMTEEIITRYFLQVGKSYYVTESFRSRYKFVPTSQYGTGFLSVFSKSDQVIVETFCSTAEMSRAIRLTLGGPRSYILVEQSDRRSTGTKIKVYLREPIKKGHLRMLVSKWCKKVEFPIIVKDLDGEINIEAEKPEDYTCEMTDVTKPTAIFKITGYPTNLDGVEGEIYILSYINETGVESWDKWSYAKYHYVKKHPKAIPPPFPETIICYHGIVTKSNHYSDGPVSLHLDYRGQHLRPSLSRDNMRYYGRKDLGFEPKINNRIIELLEQHLAVSPIANGRDGWKYKQRLVDSFQLSDFWSHVPSTIRTRYLGKEQLYSFDDLDIKPRFATLAKLTNNFPHLDRIPDPVGKKVLAMLKSDIPTLTEEDLYYISEKHTKRLFSGRAATNIRQIDGNWVLIEWSKENKSVNLIERMEISPLPGKSSLGISIHKVHSSTYEHVILNKNHPFGKWVFNLNEAFVQGRYGLSENMIKRIAELIYNAIRWRDMDELERYLEGWQNAGLPQKMHKPGEGKLKVVGVKP